MSYFKQRYEENNCRMCNETFCCVKCRSNHEESTHNIFPTCDICIVGKIILTQPSEDLLNHIKQCHWPLHCVYCKRLFGSIKELIVHNKCPIGPQKLETISNTPIRPIIKEFFVESYHIESPPIGFIPNFILLNPSTSTPMHRDEKLLDCFPDTITPVDHERKAKIQYANENLTHTPVIDEDQKKSDVYKRKVTFSGTPTTEHPKKVGIIKGSLKILKQESIQNDSKEIPRTPCVSRDAFEKTNNHYMSADDKNLEKEYAEENVIKEQKPGAIKERKLSVNETLWESALNDSIFEMDESISTSKETQEHKDEYITKQNNTEIYNQSDNSEYSLRFPRSRANIAVNRTNDSPTYTDPACGSFDLKPYTVTNTSQKPSGIWSSMAYLVKNMYEGLSGNSSMKQNKRHFSETDCNSDNELQQLKRIKLTEIKCRSPIRRHKYGLRCVIKVDKATQTD